MAASSTTVSSAGPSRPAPNFLERLRGGDEAAYVITFIAAASILLVTGLLVYELFLNSADARAKFGAVVEVVDNVRAAGVDDLGLLTDQKRQTTPPATPPTTGGQ